MNYKLEGSRIISKMHEWKLYVRVLVKCVKIWYLEHMKELAYAYFKFDIWHIIWNLWIDRICYSMLHMFLCFDYCLDTLHVMHCYAYLLINYMIVICFYAFIICHGAFYTCILFWLPCLTYKFHECLSHAIKKNDINFRE